MNLMAPKLLITAALAFSLATGTAYAYRSDLRDSLQKIRRGPIPQAQTYQEIVAKTPPPPANTNAAPAVNAKPKPSATVNLKVPFILQAPFQKWDLIHEDACEEASAAMVNLYYKGVTGPLSKDEMDKNILEAVEWEDRVFGRNKDTSAAETVRLMRELYGLDAKVVPVESMDQIKKTVAKGKPVIVPAYGRALKNPNFRQGGPLYHMLVIKGYTATKIISNDPGTRNGADYLYDEKLLWGAIHDWNGGDVPNGPKVMIVIE